MGPHDNPFTNKLDKSEHVTAVFSTRVLVKNTFWNFAGQLLPILAALFAIPVLVSSLGLERFGVLTLAWMFIGYFSIFDFGLGRALTKVVSEKLGSGEVAGAWLAMWTALLLMLCLGLVGAFAAAFSLPWLVKFALKIPDGLKQETFTAFYLLSLSIPVVLLTSGLRGMLEAHQRFKGINMVRGILGVYSFTAPLLVIPFSRSLVPIVSVLFAGRVLACLCHFDLCRHLPTYSARRIGINPALIFPLLKLGKWMTVSNLVGPLMVYLDRFLIGSLVSMTAVAYYVTPYEIVTKLWLIPAALSGVLFPAFAASLANERSRIMHLYMTGVRVIFVAMFPICFVIVTFAHDSLVFWLGNEFADRSASVLQWLAVGVLINSVAQLPFALIQSAGRADLTAKLHLFELPFYLCIVWLMLLNHGILGAAITWTIRVGFDAIMLFWLGGRIFPEIRNMLRLDLPLGALLTTSLFLVAGISLAPSIKIGVAFVFSLVFFAGAWRFLFTEIERQSLIRAFNLRSN